MADRWNLSEDVAGATLLAAGSSAPELATSFMDIFVFRNNVGVGTIVGSAVFNILVIIAVSGLFAKESLKIDWRPLTRDSIFYAISIAIMILVISDGEVTYQEALGLICIYVCYIIFMIFNSRIMNKFGPKLIIK